MQFELLKEKLYRKDSLTPLASGIFPSYRGASA
jgi:hypothetical protein